MSKKASRDIINHSETVHFIKSAYFAICGAFWLQATNDKREVTCQKCFELLAHEEAGEQITKELIEREDCDRGTEAYPEPWKWQK